MSLFNLELTSFQEVITVVLVKLHHLHNKLEIMVFHITIS